MRVYRYGAKKKSNGLAFTAVSRLARLAAAAPSSAEEAGAAASKASTSAITKAEGAKAEGARAEGAKAEGAKAEGATAEAGVPIFLSESIHQSFFRRLAWSPDGSLLVLPSGQAQVADGPPASAVYVLTRANLARYADEMWTTDACLAPRLTWAF